MKVTETLRVGKAQHGAKAKVVNVKGISVRAISPTDPAFQKLDSRFKWSSIPIIGRLLGNAYTAVHADPEDGK